MSTTASAELTAFCHILPMDEGLYCLSLGEPAMPAAISMNLPGVRLSLPPGPQSEHSGVTISTFRGDGWLDMDRPAALVHVARGPAQVMLTIYHEPSQPREAAPRVVITQLGQLLPGGSKGHAASMAAQLGGGSAAGPAAAFAAGQAMPGFAPPAGVRPFAPAERAASPVSSGYGTHASQLMPGAGPTMAPQGHMAPPQALLGSAVEASVTAHVGNRGDVQARLTEWVGLPGSRLWIEGFEIALPQGWGPGDLEYQGIIGKNGATRWLPAPEFCGSRGQTLPLLGFGIRLKGTAARLYDCSYRASFIDGSTTGLVPQGQLCQSPSQAAVEAFQISLVRKPM